MLGGTWTEHKVRHDGFIHIAAQEWKVEALLVLMNIIHSHNRKVPLVVDLKLLTHLAAVVDYYQLHEAAEVFGTILITKL
jgi:hypothetical protein